MFDATKILAGLGVFLVLVTFPFWYDAIAGEDAEMPALVYPADQEQCVEPADHMRVKHMEMLIDWREDSTRRGIKTATATDGNQYEASLTHTCLACHTNKADFCDTCHDYSGVKPSCWDCHVVPEGE